MKNILYCRRTFMATFAIITMAALSFYHGFDPSASIAAVAIGLAGTNAAEKAVQKKR